jgi:hypothetical protein
MMVRHVHEFLCLLFQPAIVVGDLTALAAPPWSIRRCIGRRRRGCAIQYLAFGLQLDGCHHRFLIVFSFHTFHFVFLFVFRLCCVSNSHFESRKYKKQHKKALGKAWKSAAEGKTLYLRKELGGIFNSFIAP